MKKRGYFASSVAGVVLMGVSASGAMAQTVSRAGDGPVAAGADRATSGTDDIIVTAQKRSQSINKVPISIVAASGEQLLQRGITSTADLAKIVPGLTAQPSPFNTTVYTLRGVGFLEFSLATPPTVAVYTDEVPLAFSAMTKAAALDLERVEVLKGPQGTLFGQNTTGGAINYVAAKPTDTLKSGIDFEYGRFNTVDAQGFISGPLTSTLKARLSARTIQSGPWQESSSRNDKLGSRHENQARLLLEWTPTDTLRVNVNINGWNDKSDSQAPQRSGVALNVPGNPNGDKVLNLNPQPLTSQSADWSTGPMPMRHNDYFIQGSLRVDFDASSDVTITSISAYNRYKTKSFQDFDGSPLAITDIATDGSIKSFSQELRAHKDHGAFRWVAGGNYQRDVTHDQAVYYNTDGTTDYVGAMRGGPVTMYNDARITTISAFGNAEIDILKRLTIQGGLRYTDSRRNNTSCSYSGPISDPNLDYAPIFEFLQTVTNPGTPFVPIGPGDCYPFKPDGRPLIEPYQQKLDEHNLSWKVGMNYRSDAGGLYYASVSKGYKAGSFPTLAPATTAAFAPVTQESVMAYEIGFKQPLFNRMIQVNGALFYYDYRDKQLRGRIVDPIFGPLEALIQVPKSRVQGAELEINARPAHGLSLSAAMTYLDTKVQQFVGYDQTGRLADYRGAGFPFSPKLSVIGDVSYERPISDALVGFVGSSLTYNSKSNASIGGDNNLRIDAYALVDVRLGVKDASGKWKLSLWGRNVTNKYYWNTVYQAQDVIVRYTGKPATYGGSLSLRF